MPENTVSGRALAAAKELQANRPTEALSLASGLRAACNNFSVMIADMAELDHDGPVVRSLSYTITDILGIADALDGSDEPF